MSKYVNHELFVCDCEDVSHQVVLNTWDFKDGSPMLDLTVKLNIFRPWYERIFIAIKYIFKFNTQNQFDTMILNNENITRFQKSLNEFNKLQKKSLIEDYNF